MNGDTLRLVLDVLGAVGTICTALGLVLPKGSTAGYWFAKIGADLKNHTQKAQ